MAVSEDELAKQRVREAVWTWTGRLLVLAVVFGFGFFAAWLLWGSGTDGAPALRVEKEQLLSQINDLKNQRADAQGKFTVAQGRLDQCLGDLQKARTTQAAQPAQP